MNAFQNKLNTTELHLKNQDYSIAFRRLTDCVLDTKNQDLYKEFIDLNEKIESNKQKIEEHTTKIFDFIQKLRSVEIQEKTNLEPLLEAEDIQKSYGGGKFQLGKINMTIHAGDVWGLVGENGNGKTTLLRILANELTYDSGIIHYNLQDDFSSTYELNTKLTYVPQRTPTWYGSLKSNLKYTASQYGIFGEENELLTQMYIIRFGLWNYRNHRWSELSSGYKMRFELARTFLRNPKILLLDEPLANLDILAQQTILEDLKSLSESISNPLGIILSSQQLFEVEKVSDKVLFLKKGKPTHLASANEEVQQAQTILEMDIHNSREELNQALKGIPLESIQYNGGMYIIKTSSEFSFNDVLKQLLQHSIQIKYVRDISKSTRRLFV